MCHKDKCVTSLACKNCATCSCLITMRPMAASKAQVLRSPSSEGPYPCPRLVGSPHICEGPGNWRAVEFFFPNAKQTWSVEQGRLSCLVGTYLSPSLDSSPLCRAPGCRLTDTHCVFRLLLHLQVDIAAACAHAQAQTSEARH